MEDLTEAPEAIANAVNDENKDTAGVASNQDIPTNPESVSVHNVNVNNDKCEAGLRNVQHLGAQQVHLQGAEIERLQLKLEAEMMKGQKKVSIISSLGGEDRCSCYL